MALTQKVRVSVFDSKAFSRKSERTGKTYTGFFNKGFLESNEPISFSSKIAFKAFDLGAFDPSSSVEVILYGKQYQDDPVKWSTEKEFEGV